MDIASSVAASRLAAQQRAMDVIADNIANANTPGFKAERVQFSDWLDAPARQPMRRAATAPSPTRRTARPGANSAPGTLTHTGNPFDLAHHRRRLLHRRARRSGPRLTRDGRFGLMPDGTRGRQRRQRGAG